MYFSHNVTYYYEPKDRNRPSDRHFVTLEEMSIIENKRIHHEYLKKQKKQEELEKFMKENFTQEEIEYLKNNWKVPE